jgi:hypothetical protein
MKYIISESSLKDAIIKKIKFDLPNRIQMVTNKYELPMEFDRVMSPQTVNAYLNKYGPMFVFNTEDGPYLYQNQSYREIIVNANDILITSTQLMDKLGIPPVFPIGYIIDMLYKKE